MCDSFDPTGIRDNVPIPATGELHFQWTLSFAGFSQPPYRNDLDPE